MNIIRNLPGTDQEYLAKLALKYNPATRALTGAILESVKDETTVETLYNSLRGTTTYDLNISKNILKNSDKWQIR